MTPKLLSPEELAEQLDYLREDARAKVEAHIAALEADSMAWLDLVQRIRNLLLFPTMGLEETRKEALRITLPLVQAPHPGTALLSEHAKALVRARNEGLETVLEDLRDRIVKGTPGSDRVIALECVAEFVESLKETEG